MLGTFTERTAKLGDGLEGGGVVTQAHVMLSS
jgi:hypothetical protein